jgi:hypothetical protein
VCLAGERGNSGSEVADYILILSDFHLKRKTRREFLPPGVGSSISSKSLAKWIMGS